DDLARGGSFPLPELQKQRFFVQVILRVGLHAAADAPSPAREADYKQRTSASQLNVRVPRVRGVIGSGSQFMLDVTSSEAVENLIRVNSWNSWRLYFLLLATNSTNFTKTITAIWM